MRVCAILGASAIFFAAEPALSRESDAQIKQKIIRQSIQGYPGNCPCPYNTDLAGRSCGRRSAYTRPGGYSPKCYESDVSASDVRAYRDVH
jgi:hypothetical protein